MNDSHLYVGIFTEERNQQFLTMLKQIADDCMQTLDQVACHNAGTEPNLSSRALLGLHSRYGQAFLAGLNSIPTWNAQIVQAEVVRALERYPSLEQNYQYALLSYIRELYKNNPPQTIRFARPAFSMFLHQFLIELTKCSAVQHLEYFQLYGSAKDVVLMNIIRATLLTLTAGKTEFTILDSATPEQTKPPRMSRIPLPSPPTPVSNTPRIQPTTPVSRTPLVPPPTPVSRTPLVPPPTPVSRTPLVPPPTPISETPVSKTPRVQAPTPLVKRKSSHKTFAERVQTKLDASSKVKKDQKTPVASNSKVKKDQKTPVVSNSKVKKDQKTEKIEKPKEAITIDLDVPLPDAEAVADNTTHDPSGPSFFDE